MNLTAGVIGGTVVLFISWALAYGQVALPRKERNWGPIVLGLGCVLFVAGSLWGLVGVAPERFMNQTGRLFFLHPPTAMNSLLIATVALYLAIGTLIKDDPHWERAMAAAVEVALLLMVILLLQGMIWGYATWGTPWVWDPRLTTTAIMAVLFAGILSLRSFATNPQQRSTWTAVATIVAYLDVPIVYFVVDMAPGLHQQRSAPDTVSPEYLAPFRLNAFGILFIAWGLIALRALLAKRQARDIAAPPTDGPMLVAGGS